MTETLFLLFLLFSPIGVLAWLVWRVPVPPSPNPYAAIFDSPPEVIPSAPRLKAENGGCYRPHDNTPQVLLRLKGKVSHDR